MIPFLGQGACIAIEDALVLGRAFVASKTFSEAFATYEGTRKGGANGVQLRFPPTGRRNSGRYQAWRKSGSKR